MPRLWRFLGGLAVVAVITASQPTCAFACSCIAPPPPAEALAAADAVFAGEVTAVSAPLESGAATINVTFAVTQRWKGPSDATLVVGTSGSSASCGVSFTTGQRYLVYASTSEGQLSTNLCSRTAPLDSAADDLAALGAGQGGATPGSLPNTGGADAPVAPLVGASVMALLAGAWLRMRSRRTVAAG